MKNLSKHTIMKKDLTVCSTKIGNVMIEYVCYMSNRNVFITEDIIIKKLTSIRGMKKISAGYTTNPFALK